MPAGRIRNSPPPRIQGNERTVLALSVSRGRHGHSSEPARDLARGLGARPGRTRHSRGERVAKVICSGAIWRVVDQSIQILGGLGITDDTVVARLFREVRPFRIYDGPSEVHRWSIARHVLRGGAAS